MNRFLLVLFSLLLILNCENKKRYDKSFTPFQKEMNEFFKDASISPLKEKDLKNFKGLDFFAFDSSYVVNADLTRTPEEKSFKMKTTTDRLPEYIKYGIVTFDLFNKSYSLNIYRNLDIINNEGYVLTNATILGQNEFAQILYKGAIYKAEVVRLNVSLNIALIKFIHTPYSIRTVNIDTSKTIEGDLIYLTLPTANPTSTIDSFLPEPVNKTGLSFFPMEVEVPYYALGGPVFNGFGELIGLTVPGASPSEPPYSNSYHLLKIEDIIKALNLTNEPDYSPVSFGSDGTGFSENIIILSNRMKDWLNKPIMTLE